MSIINANNISSPHAPSLTLRFLLAAVGLPLLCGYIYFESLWYSFHLDDVALYNDSYLQVKSLGDFRELVRQATPFRLVPLLSLGANYYLGRFSTVGYHLFNVSVHLLVSWGVLWLTWLMLEPMGAKDEGGTRRFAIALTAAALFLVHPVQTQAVTYVIQRITLLAALFSIYSLIFYILARRRRGWPSALSLGLAVSFSILALSSKQSAYVFPFFIWLYDRLFLAGKVPRSKLHPLLIVFLADTLLLLWQTRVYDFPEVMAAGFAVKGFTPWSRLITEGRVVIHYLTLAFAPLPSRLNFDYDFPLSATLIAPLSTLLAGLAILLSLVGAFAVRRNYPLFFFLVLWWWGNLALESSLIPLDLVFEHRMYLPVWGPIFLVSLGLWRARGDRRVIAGIALVLVLLSGKLASERNSVWWKETTLWEDCVEKSPHKARPHYALGFSYYRQKEYEPAVKALTQALRIDPGYWQADYLLSLAYRRLNKTRESSFHFIQYQLKAPRNRYNEPILGFPHEN